MASSSDLKNAAEELELETECPVCLVAFVPPVYQCNNGHVVCHNCLPHCKECSICRQPMPKDKVRNLQFEKVLIWLSNLRVPCPRRGDGCSVLVRKNGVEKHLLDECAFVPRRICLRISVNPSVCTAKYCIGKMDQLIAHLVNDHKLHGLRRECSDSSSSYTLLMPGMIGRKYLDNRFFIPNFIRYDDHLFFIKKYWNDSEELEDDALQIVVCLNEALATARQYFAIVQLSPTNERVSTQTVVEFVQREIVVLTHGDELLDVNPCKTFRYRDVELFTIPFSDFGDYDRTLGRGKELRYKARVTICKYN